MRNLRGHEYPPSGTGVMRARLPVMRNLSDMENARWPDAERRFASGCVAVFITEGGLLCLSGLVSS
jgi:hypothetical protein